MRNRDSESCWPAPREGGVPAPRPRSASRPGAPRCPVPFARVRALLDLVVDLCLPASCPTCGARLNEGGTRFCGRCLATIRLVASPMCTRCGVPFASAIEDHLCGHCARRPPAFRGARASAHYEGTILESLHRLKFGGDAVQAPALASLLR